MLCCPAHFPLPAPPSLQAREVTRVLKLLTAAYHWVSQVPEPRERKEGEEGSVPGEGHHWL